MIDALGRICAIPVHGASVVQAGGIPAVIAAYNRDPDNIAVVQSTAHFMQQVAKSPEGAAELVNNGGVGAIVRMMTNFADNIPVQSQCTTALQQIALAGPSEVSQIIAGGVVPLSLNNLTAHASNAPLVLESLQLLTTLGRDPTGLAQLKAAGAMDPLVTAVMTHIRDPEIRVAAQELVTLISDESTCADAVATLKALEAELKEGKMTRDDMVSKIPPASMLLGTLALAPENVQHVLSHGGLPLLTKLLDGISAMPKFKGQDQVLSTLTMAVNEIIKNAPPGTDGTQAVLAATKVIRNHPDQINAVVNSLNLLDSLSYIPQVRGRWAGWHTSAVNSRCLRLPPAASRCVVSLPPLLPCPRPARAHSPLTTHHSPPTIHHPPSTELRHHARERHGGRRGKAHEGERDQPRRGRPRHPSARGHLEREGARRAAPQEERDAADHQGSAQAPAAR